MSQSSHQNNPIIRFSSSNNPENRVIQWYARSNYSIFGNPQVIEENRIRNLKAIMLKDLKDDNIIHLLPLPLGANYLRATERWKGQFCDL